MTNDIQLFNFNQKEVRTITKSDNTIWFVASDIAKQLDYRDANNLIRILDDDEADTHIVSTPSSNQHGYSGTHNQEMSIISESGLYHAIFKSRKAEARAFRKWVTSEVLPQIRKTGIYDIEKSKLIYHIEWRNDIIIQLENEINILEKQIEELDLKDKIQPEQQLILKNTIKNRAYQISNQKYELGYCIKKIYNAVYNYFGIVKYNQLLNEDLGFALDLIKNFNLPKASTHE